jgi:serine phosphatase RsbU (regulator of sigma subunit)
MKGLFLSESSRLDLPAFFNHCSRSIKEIRIPRLFMAFTLVRLHDESLSMASAGMPPAFLYRKADASVEEILLKGMPLGAMKMFPYPLHNTALQPGDTLLLLTDGLPELRNPAGELFEYARVKETFVRAIDGTCEEIMSTLVAAGESWMDTSQQDDDITLLVIKRKE